MVTQSEIQNDWTKAPEHLKEPVQESQTLTKKQATVLGILVFLVVLLATIAIPLNINNIPATKAAQIEIEAVESLNAMTRVISLNLERNWYKTHYFEVVAERDHLKSVEIPALKERRVELKEKLDKVEKEAKKLEKEVGLDEQNNVTTSRGLHRSGQSSAGSNQQDGMAYIGTFESTAYCPGGCCGTGTGKTASGDNAGFGLVATDPRVIPTGTYLFIDGYGYAKASDTGDAIKGKRIDVCFESHATALQWGRKPIKVWKAE